MFEGDGRKEDHDRDDVAQVINACDAGREGELIFRNLYDNAIAYAGEGIHLTVSCYKEDPKFYYFSFSDNGIGVSEEHVNRIFERFYRVDKGRSRKVGGTGLGLSIVKNGVNFHKGQISAKSGLGKGMTFFFTLKKKI
mgnify:CR=1 FL=1